MRYMKAGNFNGSFEERGQAAVHGAEPGGWTSRRRRRLGFVDRGGALVVYVLEHRRAEEAAALGIAVGVVTAPAMVVVRSGTYPYRASRARVRAT